jgi:hypothetical protein
LLVLGDHGFHGRLHPLHGADQIGRWHGEADVDTPVVARRHEQSVGIREQYSVRGGSMPDIGDQVSDFEGQKFIFGCCLSPAVASEVLMVRGETPGNGLVETLAIAAGGHSLGRREILLRYDDPIQLDRKVAAVLVPVLAMAVVQFAVVVVGGIIDADELLGLGKAAARERQDRAENGDEKKNETMIPEHEVPLSRVGSDCLLMLITARNKGY